MKKLLRWHLAWLTWWLAQALPAQVVINELHYNPPGSGDETEFIEFWNIGVTTVSLAGWYMQDGLDYVFPAGSAQLEMPAILPVQPAVPGLTARLSSGGLFTDVTPCSGWQVAVNTGQATSSRLYFYLSAAGGSCGNSLSCDTSCQQLHGAHWLEHRHPDAHQLRACAARAGRGVRGAGMAHTSSVAVAA